MKNNKIVTLLRIECTKCKEYNILVNKNELDLIPEKCPQCKEILEKRIERQWSIRKNLQKVI